MTMTQAELNEVVRLHAMWLIGDAAGKKADLRSADFRYSDLRSADLSYANLRSADLRYADLSSADLRYADLRYADLSFANLRYANLSSADLSFANLSFADLSFANLSFANRSSDLRIISVSGVGSNHRMTTYRADTDEVWCGCFKGTLAQFAEKIETTHKENAQHLSDYRAVVTMFKAFAGKLENE